MADPVRDLNNFLQRQPEGNATKDFQWHLTREGPEHGTIYHVTAVFRGVNVGVGHGSTRGNAKRSASVQALEYLKTHSEGATNYANCTTGIGRKVRSSGPGPWGPKAPGPGQESRPWAKANKKANVDNGQESTSAPVFTPQRTRK